MILMTIANGVYKPLPIYRWIYRWLVVYKCGTMEPWHCMTWLINVNHKYMVNIWKYIVNNDQ
jgi:hypothetical protein